MAQQPPLPFVPPRAGTTIVATDTFTLMKVPPPPALAGLVHDIALYSERSGSEMRQVETASLVVPLLIGFEDPFELAIGRMPGPSDGFRSFTSGLTTRPVHIRSDGGCCCLEVTLTPPGARLLFGLPMQELTERLVALDDLDMAIERLRQRLGNEPDWTRRHAIAEAFLVERMTGAPPARNPVYAAYRAIVDSGGRIPVARLADDTGWSRKHLAQQFRHEIGLGPKAVARIARFERAKRLARTGTDGWADLAIECGYADQAHLSREFREFADATPSQWLAGAA
jgi:AraC-like DNA-binding protein